MPMRRGSACSTMRRTALAHCGPRGRREPRRVTRRRQELADRIGRDGGSGDAVVAAVQGQDRAAPRGQPGGGQQARQDRILVVLAPDDQPQIDAGAVHQTRQDVEQALGEPAVPDVRLLPQRQGTVRVGSGATSVMRTGKQRTARPTGRAGEPDRGRPRTLDSVHLAVVVPGKVSRRAASGVRHPQGGDPVAALLLGLVHRHVRPVDQPPEGVRGSSPSTGRVSATPIEAVTAWPSGVRLRATARRRRSASRASWGSPTRPRTTSSSPPVRRGRRSDGPWRSAPRRRRRGRRPRRRSRGRR